MCRTKTYCEYFKDVFRAITPPVLLQLLKRITGNTKNPIWSGNLASWNDAIEKCDTYESEKIFNKIVESTRKVTSGESAYERDSFVFQEIHYSWPLLTSLLWVYAREKSLRVIDFGGSLGSTYRQNHRFFDLESVLWTVVEQKHFVSIGRSEFETERLKFMYSMDEVENSNIALFASVLCYLDNPWFYLDKVKQLDINNIIIDRTPFIDATNDRICIQTVREPIYDASYPCRYFSKQRFEEWLKVNGWLVIESWICDLQPCGDVVYMGYLLSLNEKMNIGGIDV